MAVLRAGSTSEPGTDCVGLEAEVLTGVIIMLLVILLLVMEVWRGDRSTVPVNVSLPSDPTPVGLTVSIGLLQCSEGLLDCAPKWMWILLSSVVMMLPLYFLTGVCPGCFSGVILITVRLAGIS